MRSIRLHDEKKHHTTGGHEKNCFFILKETQNPHHAQGQQNEKGERRNIISVFPDNFNRNNGTFNHMIQEEKKDAKSEKRLLSHYE